MVKPGMFISDRYEIIEKVGSGGMADVYRAKCHRLNRYVAIKILKPEFSADKNLVTKFRAEAQSAAGLSHPNIVSVYDVGDDDDLHYIVMELVEGITLKKFIEKKGRLEIKEAIGIAIQIAQGLEAAHDNHIVHRDIKPQNIIISREGKVKVADFGIAKAATTNTVTQNAVGSVHYLSPEQARGGYSDEKSDIYSLGITMYEMLSGKVPFAGDNTVSVALSHIQYEPVPVKEVNPAVPYSVDKIVQKCMQKRPENRYLSASDLILDLKRSVMNPEGDFVRISAGVVSDSPTKNMTQDEMAVIKSAAKSPVTRFEANQPANKKLLHEEEEELDGTDPKWDKAMVFVVVAVAIVCMVAIVFVVSKFVNMFGTEKVTPTPGGPKIEGTPTISPTPYSDLQTVRLQNVVGRMVEDAKEVLLKQSDRFTILDGDTDYSDVYPKGMVISQYPSGGVDVTLDEEIRLVVSAGPEMLTVPNYSLWNYVDARTEAENDFKVRVEFENSSTIENNRVIRTIPERNELLAKGGELVLVVSRGEKVGVVPNLLGKTLEGARLALREQEFDVGEVHYEGSTIYEEGLVFYQSESEGNMLAVGTKIDIWVSTGIVEATPIPTPTPTPEVTPSPTPTPEATPTPVPKRVWEISFTIPWNPMNPGDVAWVYFELQTANDARYLLYDNDAMSYDELSVASMAFSVEKDQLPGVTEGERIGVWIYLNGTPALYCNASITEKEAQ
ncbi:MAG: Stk1 family PASTA domain-containing Ser/Thr kinase [Lachnospiraceae bacterium]|nr:Stk1 family PASTA domain-containing Ser/Thr kinase [Lachnospiraceae bacterium]